MTGLPAPVEQPRRLPGAVGVFALLGEVLWTGILVTVASLPLVTLPAALAAGVRHLERYLRARDSRVGLFWRDWFAALRRGGLLVGIGAAVVLGMLGVQCIAVPWSSIPGGSAVLGAAIALVLLVATLLVRTAASWAPTRTWRHALTAAATLLWADAVGSVLVAVAVGLTIVAGWQLPPLVVPALGCLAFAATVVRVRRRRRP
ncbi:hypothetical protein [Schumannella luteola]